MEIRLAFPNEADAIMQVMEDAKMFSQVLVVTSGKMAIQIPISLSMILSQVKLMWPWKKGELLAYAAVTKSPEEAYDTIYEGSWKGGESEYLVFHRIAVGSRCQGQAGCPDLLGRLD